MWSLTAAKGFIPSRPRFEIAAALRLAQLCHVFTVLALLVVGLLAPLGWPFWIGLALVCGLLAYEHSLVEPGRLEQGRSGLFYSQRLHQRDRLCRHAGGVTGALVSYQVACCTKSKKSPGRRRAPSRIQLSLRPSGLGSSALLLRIG